MLSPRRQGANREGTCLPGSDSDNPERKGVVRKDSPAGVVDFRQDADSVPLQEERNTPGSLFPVSPL